MYAEIWYFRCYQKGLNNEKKKKKKEKGFERIKILLVKIASQIFLEKNADERETRRLKDLSLTISVDNSAYILLCSTLNHSNMTSIVIVRNEKRNKNTIDSAVKQWSARRKIKNV